MALLLFGYAVLVAWQAPVLLSRLTRHAASPRLGLAAWLTAMASTLVSAALALQFLVRAAVSGWSRVAEVVCRSVAGRACAPALYQGALFELALGALATAAVLVAAVLAWQYGRGMQQSARQTRAHAAAARITGRGLACDAAAVILDAPEPVAYCLAGRPATIVLSSGALELLEPGQLAAVLAHERAHLAGRHHLLMALSRCLAACLPGVPLFSAGAPNVTRLAEMCADDAAAHRSGRAALVAALLAMATGSPVPVMALGAAAGGVAARVTRLTEDPSPAARRARSYAGLITVILALALLPAVLPVLSPWLAAHVIALAAG
jgi:Zn-dependent protease with chaperone function